MKEDFAIKAAKIIISMPPELLGAIISATDEYRQNGIESVSGIIRKEYERSLPLTAPATEAGGLGAELIAWAAQPGLTSKVNIIQCFFCGCKFPNEYEAHAPNCLHPRAVAALAHAAAPEPDTLRVRVERLAELIETFIDDEPCSFDHHGYCQTHSQTGTICAVAESRAELERCRALLQPPAREGKP